jgi:tetratricopeptide (TPR) repeat protein
MPGARPNYQSGVRAGREEDVIIELQAGGDGRRLTRADLKTLGGGSPTGGTAETSEDKAKRAEIIKKNAEIEAANKKVQDSNAIIDRTFRAGNEALRAKNYDLAIAQYDEGLSADPEHPGAPALLTNKTMALNGRAVEKFNASVKSTDDAAKTAGVEAAKKDWQAASESSAKAVAILKSATPPAATDAAAANANKTNLYFALMARADAMRLFVAKVDQSKADDGVKAYEEYIAAETDPVKKAKAQHDMAQMLFDANAYEKAKPAYEKILAESPDDADSLKNMGLILYNLGFIKEAEGKKDEAKNNYQLAANYLQQFVDKAPAGPMKTDAEDILKNMKEQQNVKAEKVAEPARRRAKP